MLRKDIINRRDSNDTEGYESGLKSNLKHTQFHDYMDNTYDEWKWFFNNLDGKIVDDEYVGKLKSKYMDTKTIVDSMLADTVTPRVVEIDESVLPNNIESTLSRMETYYLRNKEAINELNISDDLKDELYGWNNDLYTLVVEVKKGINSSILNNDNEDYDTELFGFGKKFKLDCTTAVLNLISNYGEFEFIEKGLSYLEEEDSSIRFDIEECDEVSDYINLVLKHAKKDSILLSKSTKIDNDTDEDKWELAKKNKIDYFHEPEFILNTIESLNKGKKIGKEFFDYSLECIKMGLSTYEDKKIKDSLNNLKTSIDKAISYIDSNIKIVEDDKESIDLESITNVDTGLVDLCYTPVSYADIESFAAISGLVSNGFKKLTNVVNDITSRFTVSNPDYSKMTSSFIFSKDRRYQDVYNLLVGVPKGFNGYLTDVCKHLENNISYVNILDNELDGIITILSTYINSAEYRESFIIDLTKTKSLETNATSLYNENKKIITESRDDSRPVGKLLKSANDIDTVVNSLKQLSKQIDMNQLDSIKFKMKQIDDLVSTMVNNKNNYSKNKLLEIARMIDATISLSNGVGTLLFIKSSVDTIILDIKELI